MNENENRKEVIDDISDMTGCEKKPKSAFREMFEWVACVVIAVLVAVVLKNYVLFVAEVDGNSMLDTLHDNERLITWKLGYTPKQKDIIIFEPKSSSDVNRKFYVKRVIAIEGQSVKIDYNENAVYVDGEKIDEPYIHEKMMKPYTSEAVREWTVPEDCVFVLGDNRNNSSDSRDEYSVGFVDEDSIMGKAVFRFWPLNKMSIVK